MASTSSTVDFDALTRRIQQAVETAAATHATDAAQSAVAAASTPADGRDEHDMATTPQSSSSSLNALTIQQEFRQLEDADPIGSATDVGRVKLIQAKLDAVQRRMELVSGESDAMRQGKVQPLVTTTQHLTDETWRQMLRLDNARASLEEARTVLEKRGRKRSGQQHPSSGEDEEDGETSSPLSSFMPSRVEEAQELLQAFERSVVSVITREATKATTASSSHTFPAQSVRSLCTFVEVEMYCLSPKGIGSPLYVLWSRFKREFPINDAFYDAVDACLLVATLGGKKEKEGTPEEVEDVWRRVRRVVAARRNGNCDAEGQLRYDDLLAKSA